MQNKSVFLALDDGITAADIRRVLMDAGLSKLKVFSTCENLLKEVMNVSPPDLIIADADVSDRDSLLNSYQLLRSRFNIPVIFLTRNGRFAGKPLPRDPGCDYITKPLSDDGRLLLSLERFLKRPSPPAGSPS